MSHNRRGRPSLDDYINVIAMAMKYDVPSLDKLTRLANLPGVQKEV